MLPSTKEGYTPKEKETLATSSAAPTSLDSDVKVEIIPGSALHSCPEVIPEAQIWRSYAQESFECGQFTNDSEYQKVATAVEIPPQGHYFNARELNILNVQLPPVAIDYATVANAPPPPVTAGVLQQIVLQPEGGAMPIISHAYSKAKVRHDGLKPGISSRDPILCSKDEILRFFNMHNAPPVMILHMEGYHHQKKGNTTSGGRRTVKVTDFHHKIDISRFIYPYGKITVTSDSGLTAEEMIDNYLDDKNKLRSLLLRKEVIWNTKALVYLVRRYIFALGWRRKLHVHVEFQNHTVRICDNNIGAKMYDSCLGRACMILTIVPALLFCAYGSGHRERGLRSVFVIPVAPIQVFDSIRNRIKIPHRRPTPVQFI